MPEKRVGWQAMPPSHYCQLLLQLASVASCCWSEFLVFNNGYSGLTGG